MGKAASKSRAWSRARTATLARRGLTDFPLKILNMCRRKTRLRGDLIRILGQLLRPKDRFDHIVIETTGLADPALVAQTFFVDDELKAQVRLDGRELSGSVEIWPDGEGLVSITHHRRVTCNTDREPEYDRRPFPPRPRADSVYP